MSIPNNEKVTMSREYDNQLCRLTTSLLNGTKLFNDFVTKLNLS